MQVGFVKLDGDADLSTLAAAGIVAGLQRAGLGSFLPGMSKKHSRGYLKFLAIHIQVNKRDGVETDFDAKSGILHGVVTDTEKGHHARRQDGFPAGSQVFLFRRNMQP